MFSAPSPESIIWGHKTTFITFWQSCLQEADTGVIPRIEPPCMGCQTELRQRCQRKGAKCARTPIQKPNGLNSAICDIGCQIVFLEQQLVLLIVDFEIERFIWKRPLTAMGAFVWLPAAALADWIPAKTSRAFQPLATQAPDFFLPPGHPVDQAPHLFLRNEIP